MKLIRQESPNCGERRDCAQPDLVVLHYTAMTSAEAACRTLCNPETEVSAHYLIAEDGRVFQLVEEEKRAWHAGAGSWRGVNDVNSHSIGIEMANTGFTPFAAPLMAALEDLLAGILARWNIPAERVIGHSDMAPGRKIDPGVRFDWMRLARQGLAIWPRRDDAPPDTEEFHACLMRFGYPSDVSEELRLEAFRRRFSPAGSGPISAREMGMAQSLRDGNWLKF